MGSEEWVVLREAAIEEFVFVLFVAKTVPKVA